MLIGSLVTISAPETAEIMALAGFDYLWMETEHAPLSFAQAQNLIQAVGGRCPCVVRIPENAEVWIKRALDIGCDGLVVPQVKSGAAARQVVECCLYPPAGRRGVGIGRAHGYGATFQEYVDAANDNIAIIVQVEHIDAVPHIANIVRTPGIDAVFIGPFDLSGSMGLLGQIDHPRVQEAIQEIMRHCKDANMPVGMFAVDATAANRAVADGVTFVALGMDATFLLNAAKQAVEEVKKE